MNRTTRIKQKLEVLKPHSIQIIDETPNHFGHLANDDQLETHLKLIIESDSLKGLSLIKQHKIINDLLKEEFNKGLHALSIKILKNIEE